MFENHSKFRKAERTAALTVTEALYTGERAPAEALPASPLARLRLLVALDALLVHGGVSGAARALEISTPAMSRLLAQLRGLYEDELLCRSGRNMVPTPLAGALRARVRALAAEADALISARLALPMAELPAVSDAAPINRLPLTARGNRAETQPALSTRPADLPEGQPDPALLARRLLAIGGADEPRLRLARYVATVGAGAGRARPLHLSEAEDAFGIVLDGEADPIQIGALLVAMQIRGATAEEFAGMVKAARHRQALRAAPGEASVRVDLDWPAYLSPRNTRPPWFLVAARLLAKAGHRVLLHGYGPGISQLVPALDALGIAVATQRADLPQILGEQRCAFLPLPVIDPQLQALINLYRLFEMRAPVNMVVQLLNPLGARASVVGVASAAARALPVQAERLLGARRLLCVDSHRDVAQATPHRLMTLAMCGAGATDRLAVPPAPGLRPLSPPAGFSAAEMCMALWEGRHRDAGAVATVIDSAALGLMALEACPADFASARAAAAHLWEARHHLSP